MTTPDRPNADQLYRALLALGREPVPDPEFVPDGPTEMDRPAFLALSRTAAAGQRWEPMLAERARLTARQLSALEGSLVIDAAEVLVSAAAELLHVAAMLETPGLPGELSAVEITAAVETADERIADVPGSYRKAVDELRRAGRLGRPI